MRKIVGAMLVLLVAAGAAGYFYLATSNKYIIQVPPHQPPGELVMLDQGWTEAQRVAFHHVPQGTRLVPYAWFKALEQPCLSLFECDAFTNTAYLGRFGFIPSKVDAKWNPDGLPIGFAVQNDFHDPVAKKVYPAIGLACAACHTGELRFEKYSVLVEGAPATIEVTQFQRALGLALAFTQEIPFRYGRFESRVLGPNATDQQKKELQESFDGFMHNAQEELEENTKRAIYVNEAGFSRTDALTRIGNQVFAADMKNYANLAVSNAPVRFPQIWDASWFTWVQYNSSISDPMVRNIGEALGVRAAAKLHGPDATEFNNSVQVEGLQFTEEMLSGQAPYQGLRSPKWPSVFPALDMTKVARGEVLYRQHCSGCHLPPVNDLVADLNAPRPKHWWKNSQGKFFLKVVDVPLDEIGTDRHEAEDFINRVADTGALGKGKVSAAEGLRLVTTSIRDKYYSKMGFAPEKQIMWNGYRDPADESIRAPKVYKARPLNGIWAVGPYLHNGSVPNLFLLLSPKECRPTTFWTGSKQFDPVHVGRDTTQLPGGFEFKTDRPGNSNAGHEFNDGPRGNGTIGPKLSDEDRWALVEFLKSM